MQESPCNRRGIVIKAWRGQNELTRKDITFLLPAPQPSGTRPWGSFFEESCGGSAALSTRKLATLRTESYFSRNEANALAKKFRLDIPDRTPIAQLRGDRDALQKRVKYLKAELAMLRERHSYGKP